MRLGASLLLLLVPAAAWAGFKPAAWLYYKDVTGAQMPGFCALSLDPEALAAARADISDLRIVSDGKQEQPYELRLEQDQTSVQQVAARMYNQSRVPGQGARFELDLGATAQPVTQITIETPDQDFRYQVTVEGSNDAREWAVLRRDGAIFDFTGDVQLRSTLVKLPEARFRYLRITVHDAEARPLRVTGATVERAASSPVHRTELRSGPPRITVNASSNTTDVYLDLGYPNQPFDTVDVLFTDDNVRREVSVYANNADNFEGIMPRGGVVFRYHTATFRGEQTRVRCDELKGRYVWVSVANRDNKPLHVTGVRLYAIPRQVVFQWDPNRRFRLYYGGQSVAAPQYDLAEYLRLQRIAPRGGLILGPQQSNPDYRSQEPWTEQRPWLLWLVIALAVVVVGGLTVRMMTRIGPPPEEP